MTREHLLQTLKGHLQTAIEIEHATLPPYLFAYWSIHGQSPQARQAAGLILSVIREEMLHMAMAANMLNAIGGHPNTKGPHFIPKYPSILPGHTQTINPFKVHLAPCGIASIQTFMQIELPERLLTEKKPEHQWATIGQFYEEVASLVNHPLLEETDFKHGRQLNNDDNPGKGILYTVHTREDALKVIDEILDQGEGHDAENPFDADHELTHFFKFHTVFEQINNGAWEIKKEVWPVSPDPDEHYFSEDTKAINQQFNVIYSELLDTLHEIFNGNGVFDDSVRLMMALQSPACRLMQIPLQGKPGNAGPTFCYIEQKNR